MEKLALAVLARAVGDYRSGHESARLWLRMDNADLSWWADVAGVRPELVIDTARMLAKQARGKRHVTRQEEP